ncbi:hypothetical protein FPV67DRAFT_290691 [Lyophyllum atratum]|nr:hypothetical protein FPV67DRAFT_290691 [Lyophyllum atratum]
MRRGLRLDISEKRSHSPQLIFPGEETPTFLSNTHEFRQSTRAGVGSRQRQNLMNFSPTLMGWGIGISMTIWGIIELPQMWRASSRSSAGWIQRYRGCLTLTGSPSSWNARHAHAMTWVNVSWRGNRRYAAPFAYLLTQHLMIAPKNEAHFIAQARPLKHYHEWRLSLGCPGFRCTRRHSFPKSESLADQVKSVHMVQATDMCYNPNSSVNPRPNEPVYLQPVVKAKL